MLYYKKNKVQKYIDNLQKKLGIYVHGNDLGTFYKSFAGSFIVSGVSKVQVDYKFGNEIQKILTSEFAENIYSEIKADNGGNISTDVLKMTIDACEVDSRLEFCPRDNLVVFSNEVATIDELLNTEINIEKLSDFHREHILKSDKIDYRWDTSLVDNSKDFSFYDVVSQNKTMKLVPKK